MQKPREKRRDWGSRSFVDDRLHTFRLYHERRVIGLEKRLRTSERDNLGLSTEATRLRTKLGMNRRGGGEE